MIGQSVNLLSNIMMKLVSSISSGKSLIMAKIPAFIQSVLEFLFLYLARLVYAVCKWLFYLIDIIFFYIRQLTGLNVDTSSLSSMASGETDLVFNMLYTNSNLVTQILKQLTGLAIVVMVILSIVAIIKTHYDTMNTGAPGDNKKVLKNILKALTFILITPIICVGGIMMSNVLIKSLYNATNITGSYSLGGSVFSLASSSGNAYRIYAQNGDRIPIFYEFSEQEKLLEQIEKKEFTQKSIEYLTSKDNPAYQTHLMFENGTHYLFDELNKDESLENDYYAYYDKPANSKDEYTRFTAHREEYFIMADFVDFAVKTSTKFYIKNIEEVLDSAKSASNEIYSTIKNQYGIDDSGEVITFINSMVGYDEVAMQPGSARTEQYYHKKGALDELYGAVFIVTVEKTTVVSGISHTYYEPVTNGYRKTNDTAPFESDFIKNGNMVIAKGVFTADHLPTALKRDKNGTDIICYRDNLKPYDLGDVAGLSLLYPHQDDSNIFTSVVRFFKKLFNIKDTEVKFDINSDAVKITYKKQTDQVAKFRGGYAHMSYLFDKGEFFNPRIEHISVNNFYVVTKFNFLILIVGAWLLLKTCAMAVFKLIQRIYELFLLFIFYPASCASFPLDDGAGYKQWLDRFISKLFSTYGLILGINLVLVMAPLVERIQFFTAGEISGVKQLRRMGYLFFNIISNSQMARMLNLTCAIMFQLVAFSLMSNENSSITKIVKGIIGGEDVTEQNPATEMISVVNLLTTVTSWPTKIATTGIKGITKAVSNIGQTVSHPWQTIKGLPSKAMKLAPMSAVVSEVKDDVYRKQKKKEQKVAMRNLEEALDSSTATREEVEKYLGEVLNSQKEYLEALNPARTRDKRKAEKDKRDEEEYGLQGAKNSKEGDEQSSKAQERFSGMSDEELEKAVKEAGEFKGKKVDKFLKGKLHGKKAEDYRKAEETEELGMIELERRKKRKEDIEQRLKEVEELKHKGNLTEEEQQKLKENEEKLRAYQDEIIREKESYDLSHSFVGRIKQARAQKREAKRAKRYERNKTLFRHQSKGFRRISQGFQLWRSGRDTKSSVKQLERLSVDSSLYEGKSLPEIDKALKEGRLSKAQRDALISYRDTIERRQDLLEIRNREYSNAAAAASQKRIRKDERQMTSRKPFSQMRRESRDQKLNSTLEQLEIELAEVQKEIEEQTQMVTGADYKRLRKLNEKKVALQRKVEVAQAWNKSYTEDGVEVLRQQQAAERRKKRREWIDDVTGLSDHAVDYWQNDAAGDGIATTEKVEAYKQGVRRSRNKRAKRVRQKIGLDKDK